MTGHTPAIDSRLLAALQRVVGKEQVATAAEERLSYAYDGSGREHSPAAVVFPENCAQIAAILRLAGEYQVPVIPRGAGTGMCGGAVATRGGIMLALSRMDQILEIDADNQVAVVQPGVITADLQRAVQHHGLYYPPDPASRAFCTIGGNVACGAGGPAAVKYGVTRDYVLGLKAVLANGDIIHTGVRTAKGVVGYDLTRLLVGSEGTLAVIGEITLRLVPAPTTRQTMLLLCRDLQQATGLVSAILRRLTPATLEYLDRTALNLVADRLPAGLMEHALSQIGQSPAAMLLLELDGNPEEVAGQTRQLNEFLQDQPGVLVYAAADREEAEQLWAARRAVSPAAFKLRPHKISDDIVVPRSRIPELVAAAEQLAADTGLPIFTFGHAGDGNIHVNIMLDRDDPREAGAAEGVRAAIQQRTLALGGTLSGEHGVGISKAAAITAELDQAGLELMKKLKRLFDPGNILNPGKIFPDQDV
ncbi:FAD-binding oxidoreductase [Desulfurivibrio alkaliphilus]|uniref:FAD linked oxidase domain protein n=1 Tax=Desulfurivibrio alkaliphilus (strain DSM 19089 / UNIQEM U267 / AHT2) TaxID=589865 RepID=D6Z6A3_DESAT|nr:FAD-linked oxidase C-terminal domain-containing protein [Desulfurivibrio alkaliphilus]ADH86868.1 FAD linked oxidase domain protein [Desulfurivibrio alkaliphilus AHT 2]